MPIDELIDAGYQLSGPGDTLTATGHGTHFDVDTTSDNVEARHRRRAELRQALREDDDGPEVLPRQLRQLGDA